jgi:hypothetical protein
MHPLGPQWSTTTIPVDVCKAIHPRPTRCENSGMVAEWFEEFVLLALREKR